jgi:hypothetical protein
MGTQTANPNYTTKEMFSGCSDIKHKNKNTFPQCIITHQSSSSLCDYKLWDIATLDEIPFDATQYVHKNRKWLPAPLKKEWRRCKTNVHVALRSLCFANILMINISLGWKRDTTTQITWFVRWIHDGKLQPEFLHEQEDWCWDKMLLQTSNYIISCDHQHPRVSFIEKNNLHVHTILFPNMNDLIGFNIGVCQMIETDSGWICNTQFQQQDTFAFLVSDTDKYNLEYEFDPVNLLMPVIRHDVQLQLLQLPPMQYSHPHWTDHVQDVSDFCFRRYEASIDELIRCGRDISKQNPTYSIYREDFARELLGFHGRTLAEPTRDNSTNALCATILSKVEPYICEFGCNKYTCDYQHKSDDEKQNETCRKQCFRRDYGIGFRNAGNGMSLKIIQNSWWWDSLVYPIMRGAAESLVTIVHTRNTRHIEQGEAEEYFPLEKTTQQLAIMHNDKQELYQQLLPISCLRLYSHYAVFEQQGQLWYFDLHEALTSETIPTALVAHQQTAFVRALNYYEQLL